MAAAKVVLIDDLALPGRLRDRLPAPAQSGTSGRAIRNTAAFIAIRSEPA
jgi:hypothetical protein